MEVIQDELQKNGVNVDIETLTEHIEYILNNYRDTYTHAVERLSREELLLDVFHQTDVNSLGRAMSYLTLVVLSRPSTTGSDVTQVCPRCRDVTSGRGRSRRNNGGRSSERGKGN